MEVPQKFIQTILDLKHIETDWKHVPCRLATTYVLPKIDHANERRPRNDAMDRDWVQYLSSSEPPNKFRGQYKS